MIDDGRTAVIDIAYLIAAVFFIFGLKFLSSPKSARQGNQLAALGMGLAVLATFLSRGWESGNYVLIIVGILIGGPRWSPLASSPTRAGLRPARSSPSSSGASSARSPSPARWWHLPSCRRSCRANRSRS
jgi:hypothetical protein